MNIVYHILQEFAREKRKETLENEKKEKISDKKPLTFLQKGYIIENVHVGIAIGYRNCFLSCFGEDRKTS